MAQTNPISRLPWAQDSFKTGVGWGVFGGARGIQGDLQAQIPCLNDNLSGDDTFVLCRFRSLSFSAAETGPRVRRNSR